MAEKLINTFASLAYLQDEVQQLKTHSSTDVSKTGSSTGAGQSVGIPAGNQGDISTNVPTAVIESTVLNTLTDREWQKHNLIINGLPEYGNDDDVKQAEYLFIKICEEHLTCAKSSCDRSGTECNLTETKDRGGLQQPSDDVVKLFKLSESQFRSVMAPGQRPVVITGLKQTLTNSVLRSCIGVDLFEELTEHIFNSDPDHRVLLMKKVVEQHIICRLHRQAKCFSRAIYTHSRCSKLAKTELTGLFRRATWITKLDFVPCRPC